ncbi:hypothetical protein [Phenylobacterium sp.]|uniref:hypothetical protein n=1 Tax=Phenylobacterium sp. TaxID=1871053 RepID=UPI0035B1EF42
MTLSLTPCSAQASRRRLSVAPEVLAACALEGRNPRRSAKRRNLRLVSVIFAVGFCLAFWIVAIGAVLRLLG